MQKEFATWETGPFEPHIFLNVVMRMGSVFLNLVKTEHAVAQLPGSLGPDVDAARVRRSGKRGRSPLPQALQPNRPHKRSRRGRGLMRGKARCSEISELDGKRKLTKVEVQDLRYSQISCSEFFSCGRGVMQLVEDLLNRKVSLSAPFLRLTVFETTARRTHKTILRCIDNRRLFALKEYAKKSGKDRVMVNVNLYSQTTLTEVQRFIQNSDNTPGVEVRFRQGMHGRHF